MDMINVLSLMVIIGLVCASAFFQLSILVWTALIGIPLLVFSLLGYFTFVMLLILWLFFLGAALFANLTALRRQYLIKPAISRLQQKLPAISDTEREALEAGNTWWEKELFCGRPNWDHLFQIPAPTLSQEEENFLNNQVEKLCEMVNDWQIVEKHRDLPPAIWDYLKEEKFFGMVIPKQYGGLGFSALAHSTVVTKLATRSVSTAVNTMVPNSLGPAELLLHYGTDEQKNYFLPRLAKGEEIPCFALTGPEAGSDAGAIPDTGVVCKAQFDGKEVLGIRLNWDKRYITLAPIATVLGVAFRLYDPDGLLGDKKEVGITLGLIPTKQPGIEIGHRHYPLYLAFMNGPTKGKDVFIPLDWIIGGPSMAGQGWRMLMECLSIGRSISLPALATACGKVAYRYTGAYARIRRQFNTPLASFEGIEEALAQIAGYTYLLEATRIMTAGAVDLKVKPSIASAIAKYHMTELARQVITHAMDIHAGYTIQVGPRNFLANIYLAVPISITVEGANILTRNLIIFGQGAIRCHPYLLKEVELISASKPSVEELDKVLMSHVGFFISNCFRSLIYGLTGGLFISANVKNKRLKKYQRQLTRMSAALALLSDTSLILLGGSLKRRERISARLGDIMSQLYLASATLKYFQDQGMPNSDVDYVCWAIQECLYKIQIACNELFTNYPNRLIGLFLQSMIFPFGSAYERPSDHLGKILVKAMSDTALRDRLTKYAYVGKNDNETSYLLDEGLKRIITIDPLLKKLQKSMKKNGTALPNTFSEQVKTAEQAGFLTSEEANELIQFESLKKEIIKVNEFSFNLEQVIA